MNNDEQTANATASSAIALMRIYDVLMSMYAEMNEEDARKLAEIHRAGGIRSTLPFLDME